MFVAVFSSMIVSCGPSEQSEGEVDTVNEAADMPAEQAYDEAAQTPVEPEPTQEEVEQAFEDATN